LDRNEPRSRALRIVGIYVVASMVWIWLSDRVVYTLFGGSPALASNVSSYKGFAWILFVGCLLYLLFTRDFKAIQAGEERLRFLYRDNPSLYFTVSVDGAILSANRFAADYFGYSREELVGRPYLELVYEEDQASFSGGFADVVARSDEVVSWEYRKKTRDGRVLWIKESARAARGPDGAVVVLLVGNDVTERRLFIEALAASEERYRLLAESGPDTIFIIGRDLKVEYVNNVAAAHFRGVPADLVGRSLDTLFPAEMASRMEERLRGVLGTGEPLYAEDITVFPTGDQWQGTWLTPLRNQSGEATGVFGVGRDISEAKRVEQLKSDFLSMASHELRTPLTSIIGYCDLLSAADRLQSAELYERVVGNLRERGDHMKRLVDDLLELSRIESGDFLVSVEAWDPAAVVRGCVEAARLPEALNLEVDLPEDLPAALIDRDRLAYAIDNLLSNAVKFSPEGGTITVWARESGDDIEIGVADQGVGIAPEDVERVFDRFTQADMSATRRFGGFGMGLHIVKTIAQAHGGRVELESEPGRGSTFRLYVPAAKPDL
jgi:PAS domain S-box-containing protein